MKNEDRIIELLAEMLQRMDRSEGRIERMENHLERFEETAKENTRQMIEAFNTGFGAMLDKLSSIDTELKGLRQHDLRLADHEERIRKLEGKTYDQAG